MTDKQINWAMQHDWFRDVVVINNKRVCEVYCSEKDRVITISSYSYLREWAGY